LCQFLSFLRAELTHLGSRKIIRQQLGTTGARLSISRRRQASLRRSFLCIRKPQVITSHAIWCDPERRDDKLTCAEEWNGIPQKRRGDASNSFHCFAGSLPVYFPLRRRRTSAQHQRMNYSRWHGQAGRMMWTWSDPRHHLRSRWGCHQKSPPKTKTCRELVAVDDPLSFLTSRSQVHLTKAIQKHKLVQKSSHVARIEGFVNFENLRVLPSINRLYPLVSSSLGLTDENLGGGSGIKSSDPFTPFSSSGRNFSFPCIHPRNNGMKRKAKCV